MNTRIILTVFNAILMIMLLMTAMIAGVEFLNSDIPILVFAVAFITFLAAFELVRSTYKLWSQK